MPHENPKYPSQSLTPAQALAVRQKHEIGETIAREHPLVADDYRNGLNCREISLKYRFDLEYGLAIRSVTEAVRTAVKILIPDKAEIVRLARAHINSANLKSIQQKKGIHALSPEQKSQCESVGVLTFKTDGKGIFSLPQNILSDMTRLGKLRSGNKVPWDILIDLASGLSEGEFCDRLAQDPQFQFRHGHKIVTRATEIAQQLNNKFHGGKPVRSPKSVFHRIKRYGVSINPKN